MYVQYLVKYICNHNGSSTATSRTTGLHGLHGLHVASGPPVPTSTVLLVLCRPGQVQVRIRIPCVPVGVSRSMDLDLDWSMYSTYSSTDVSSTVHTPKD